MARGYRGAIALGVVITMGFGCGLMKKKSADTEDAGAVAATDTTSAAPVDAAPPPPEAANVDEVKHFDGDTKLDHTPATIKYPFADVRREPGATVTGSLIGTLKMNTSVQELAEHSQGGVTYALILYTDPSNANQKLEGWVNKRVFSPPVDAGIIKRIPCPNPALTPFVSENGEDCELLCTTNGQCPKGEACEGDGYLMNLDGTQGNHATFCRTADVEPGPGNAPDAGPVPTTSGTTSATTPPSASTPPSATTPPSASTPPPRPKLPPMLPGALGCVAGYTKQGQMCLLQCQTADDCSGRAGFRCDAVSHLCSPQ